MLSGERKGDPDGDVYVACKLPQGFVFGEAIRVEGTRHSVDNGEEAPELVGGYRITKVPAAQWDRWYRVNQRSAMVVNQIVFADPDLEVLKAKAKKLRGVSQAAPLRQR